MMMIMMIMRVMVVRVMLVTPSLLVFCRFCPVSPETGGAPDGPLRVVPSGGGASGLSA